MATLNQFQKYQQSENTITNNVLLMLSSMYEISSKFYEDYLNALFESSLIAVIPMFHQQVGNKGNGIIDGRITTNRTSIIFENKINTLEGIDKLIKYSDSFNPDEVSILVHLSSTKFSIDQIEEINTTIHERYSGKAVHFFSLTYEDLVIQLNDLQKVHPFMPQLERLAHNFEDYCSEMGLRYSDKHVLRVMACGHSYDLNIKHRFYFDMADRGFRPFEYFGIYKNKTVTHIANIENEIEADWDKGTGLAIKSKPKNVATDVQVARLCAAIEEATELGWQISKGHRFFLLENLTETKFKKDTPGGIFRVKYFNLEDLLNRVVPTNINDIAKGLYNRTWPTTVVDG